MLEAIALRKNYGKIAAVDGISLKAGKGETIGLLGPNGAGKTTTVSMIAGLLRPDSGEVLIDGRRLQGDTDPLKRQYWAGPAGYWPLRRASPPARTSTCSARSTAWMRRAAGAPSTARSIWWALRNAQRTR